MARKVSPTEQFCMNAMHELAQAKMIDHISVQDILDATGISKATFYRHFSDKYDLHEKMLRRDVDYIFTDSCDLALWEERIGIFIRGIKSEEKIYLRMVKLDPTAFTTFYTNVLSGLLNKRLERIGVAPPFPDRLRRRCVFLSAGLAEMLCGWIAEGCAAPADVIVGEFNELIRLAAHGTELSSAA